MASRRGAAMRGISAGGLIAAACLLAGATAQEFDEMEFVMPLYIAPKYENGTMAAQWVALHDTAQTGATVFGILNPASGPGTETQPNYLDTIEYVKGAGAQLICYVATTYGEKSMSDVEAEIVAYETLYPDACDGIFFDESPFLLGDLVEIYQAHNTFAHETLDLQDSTARIVFNAGQAADEQYYAFTPKAEVVGLENYFKVVRQLGLMETPTISTPDQNMLLLHSAFELVESPELIPAFMKKAYCKGFGTMYVTDDLFDLGNPWDDPPSFWFELLDAAKSIPSAEECDLDGLKVLVPLLGTDPDDLDAIIASADPGDYGDLITVAMNVQITESAELTDAAAAIRDAGAKVLCYIDATDSTDLAALEDAVEVFTFFPLNEICAGFFFGGFNIMTALEDILALQSLYTKTQQTFLQATVVFAPNVVDNIIDTEVDSGSYSYSYDGGEYLDFDDDWIDSGIMSEFYLPWQEVMSSADVVALAEALMLGLAEGATNGEIIVASTLDGTDAIPASGAAPENSAAVVTGYSGAPQEVMFELFANDWGYGYVTDLTSFETLSTEWAAVVVAAEETNDFVVTSN